MKRYEVIYTVLLVVASAIFLLLRLVFFKQLFGAANWLDYFFIGIITFSMVFLAKFIDKKMKK